MKLETKSKSFKKNLGSFNSSLVRWQQWFLIKAIKYSLFNISIQKIRSHIFPLSFIPLHKLHWLLTATESCTSLSYSSLLFLNHRNATRLKGCFVMGYLGNPFCRAGIPTEVVPAPSSLCVPRRGHRACPSVLVELGRCPGLAEPLHPWCWAAVAKSRLFWGY